MDSVVRAFIALPMPVSVQEYLARICRKLQSGGGADIKWVSSNQFHLTLKFLGDIEESRTPNISAELARIASHQPPWKAHITHLGAFPNPSSPRVIWIGIEDGGTSESVFRQVEDALAAMGFDREARAYAAHITLGRKRMGGRHGKGDGDLFHSITIDPMEIEINRIVLFRSILSSAGATYTEISNQPFGGDACHT